MRFLASIWIAFATFAASAGDPASGPLRNRVDLNNAPKETIQTLPGVGPKLADQIIAARPYSSVQQLEKVQGIGAKKFAQLRPHVYILPSNALPSRVPSSATNSAARVNIN